MIQRPTELSSTVFEIANVRVTVLRKQDDDDTNPEISIDNTEDLGQST
jgi:hypothetical protein